MRRTITAITCTICAVLLCGVGHSAEMRGLWVDAFHPGLHTPQETTEMVAKAKASNFNALFVEVRRRGDVYYNSAIEPKASDAALGYDSLADIITKAHAVGMQVHAWLPMYEVYHDVPLNRAQATQVHKAHPEWLMKDKDGRTKFPGDKIILDPGIPAVRDYLVGVVRELVTNYNVDGVHLDIARYPSRYGGYNETSLARYAAETGRSGKPAPDDEAWCTWRRAQVTLLVRDIHQMVKAAKPGVEVSAAVFADTSSAKDQHLQDWDPWFQAGYLDFAVPMAFSKDNGIFQKYLIAMAASTKKQRIYMGQAGWKSSGDASIAQVGMARSAGFVGVVVYSYDGICRAHRGESASIMDRLKAGLFATADTPPVLTAQ